MHVDPIVCVQTHKLRLFYFIIRFPDAPRLWRTSVSTAGTATITATYSTESSRSFLPSAVRLVTCSIIVTIHTLSMLRAGLHDSDRRPHWHRHGRWEHLGRRVRGRIPGHAETRPTVHPQHGQRRPRHQRLTVLRHCCTHCESFISFSNAASGLTKDSLYSRAVALNMQRKESNVTSTQDRFSRKLFDVNSCFKGLGLVLMTLIGLKHIWISFLD